MKLGRAYKTLKDESERRAYDSIYPSIIRSRPSPQTTKIPRSAPASTPQTGVPSEAAQIAALQKSKQERGAQWWIKKNMFDSSIFELQREIRRLQQEIKRLDIFAAAEAAEEAKKNSWGTWFLSPIYKKVEESEEEKANKDRKRRERGMEKDMKERRLGSKQTDLKGKESLFQKAKEEVDLADVIDDRKIRALPDKILARETLKRQEKEKAERQERERMMREQRARMWKQEQEQQEKRQREAAEAFRRQQAEEKAAAQRLKEE